MTAFTRSAGTLASDIARAWLALYTIGLPATVRERRAAELESDLWEHEADRFANGRSPGVVAIEVLGRMVRGMPADLLWRFSLEGPQMQLNIPLERIMGALLLTLVVLIPIAVGIDGYDTARVGWESELLRLASLSQNAIRANVIFQSISGVSLIAAAAGMYLTLAPRARNVATFAAFGLVSAGVLTLAASAMYQMLSTLADDYAAGRGGDDLVVTSRAIALGMQSFAAAAGVLLAASVYLMAVAAYRHHLVPRGLAWIAVASAACVVGAIVTEATTGSDLGWAFFMGGFALLLIWLLAAGASLLLGFRRPAGGAAPLGVAPA